MTPSRRCALRPEPLQQLPDERAGGLRVVNGVSTTGPDEGDVRRVYLPPSHLALLRHQHRQGVRQADYDDVSPPAVADGGPAEAQRAQGVRRVRGQRRGEVQAPPPRDGGPEDVLPGHQGEPLLQAAARAQCGVMRAAATHTTTKPNSREQFCSAECRQQTAVRRGQSVGQLPTP